MAVRIIADGSCDLSAEECSRLDIIKIPLQVFFGDECFVEGENMTTEEFYARLSSSDLLPKTAQISPGRFEEVYAPLVEAGDEIVVLPISKELSGTYHSACMAREAFPEACIYVADTQNVTFPLGLLVYEACRMRDEGLSGQEIHRRIETDLAPRLRLYAVIDDLKYLRLGGRLSSAGAAVGTLLGIKPLVTIEGGKVINIHKARGQKAAMTWIAERLKEEYGGGSLYLGHSDAPEKMAELEQVIGDFLDSKDVRRAEIGSVVGTHAGPGCAGVAFFAKSRIN